MDWKRSRRGLSILRIYTVNIVFYCILMIVYKVLHIYVYPIKYIYYLM